MSDYDPNEMDTGAQLECENCGDMVHVTYNGECITKCSEMVHKADLRELVEEWRDFAEVSGWDGYSKGIREATEACADELERVVERDG